MSKKIKVAVIGGGNMGLNHIRKYAQIENADLVAVVDVNKEIAKVAKEFGATYYDNYVKMLDTEKPDAVSVVVPTPMHYEIADAIMSRGIHCMLEKPIAGSVEEAKKLIQISKKNCVIFSVGHVEHYNPVVIKLKELISEGEIGEITSIICKRVGGFPPREPKSDVIVDLAVHDIGIINYLLNSNPVSITSHASRTLHSSNVDAAEILLDYGHTSGFIQTNWTTPIKIRTISITGTKGYIEANYLTQELNFYESNITKETGANFETFIKSVGEPKHHIIKTQFEEPLLVELERFLSHVSGDKSKYLVSADEALHALDNALVASDKHK